MKKAILVALLFLTGCSSNEGHSVTKGNKRDLGKGFHTIEVRTELPEGSPEKYHLSRDLCYKSKKIDEALYAYISPSGRFAVYESMIHGGIVLYDTKGAEKYRVLEGTVPSIETWSKDEKNILERAGLEVLESVNIHRYAANHIVLIVRKNIT